MAAICGVTVLLDVKLGGSIFGLVMGLTGAIFAGLTVCLIKKLRENDGPVVIYLFFCMLGALITFPAFIADPVFPATGVDWLMVGGIACTSVIAQLLMNQGFQYCKSWEGGLFLTGEILFTAVFGICILGELTTWRFWAGGLLILGSVVFFNFVKTKSNAQPLARVSESQTAVP
ncbi:DMT family transporter [Thermodesulfobacteriota bacterium]